MKRISSVELLQDFGTAKFPEDGFIVRPPFFGVVDAVSTPYAMDSSPPKFYDGLTDGQVVRNIIVETFSGVSANLSLAEALTKANRRIAEFQQFPGTIDYPRLAGVSFVFAKIGKNEIEIIQGGDCFALWDSTEKRDSGITKNQAYQVERARIAIFSELMRKNKGDRKKAWKDYQPIFLKAKIEETNVNYAELNGQEKVSRQWQRVLIPSDFETELLLLFSDGFVPFENTKDSWVLGKLVLSLYRIGQPVFPGLKSILNYTRAKEAERVFESHIVQAEATALAIRFEEEK